MTRATVTVGRKWDEGAVSVTRGTIFGNPFNPSDSKDLKNLSDKGRDEVCDAYETYFLKRLKEDPVFREAFKGLVIKAKQDGHITLGCFCSPKRCHAETIKRYIELILEATHNR